MKLKNFLVDSKFAYGFEGVLDADALTAAVRNGSDSAAYHCLFNIDASAMKYQRFTGEIVKTRQGGERKETIVSNEPPGERTFNSFDGYAAPVHDLVFFDFDAADLETAWADTKRFRGWLDIDVEVAFSGSKGFHVAVPFDYFGLEPGPNLPHALGALATELEKFFPSLDKGIYNVNRKFRALNSRHEKTGLYKTLVSWNDDVATILEKARTRSTRFYSLIWEDHEPLKALVDVLAAVKTERAQASENAGTRDEPTLYEAFAGKKCIAALLQEKVPGELNDCGLIIAYDLFKTGKTKNEALSIFNKWTSLNGIGRSDRLYDTLDEIYNGRKYHNHGCLNPIKMSRCSSKCRLWNTIDPLKRPKPKDMTPQKAKRLEKAVERRNKPSEMDVVHRILSPVFGCKYNETKGVFEHGNLRKKDHDIFYYNKGRWIHCQNGELDFIKTRIGALYEHGVGVRKINDTFRHLELYIPSFPKEVNPFNPPDNMINFKNGTLHLEEVDGKMDLVFKEHSKTDYLMSILDHDYTPDIFEGNDKMDAMLESIFDGEADCAEKIQCLQEMFGAALVPAFPHLFMLYGVPESGKTQICKILMRLLGDQDNISAVQPHELNGFNMESMLGKLVNIVTDINTQATIEDSIVKQIEDRIPLRIDRKNKTALYAKLPAVHIFGANGLPRTFDGSNKAHTRRWTIIKFNRPFRGTKFRNVADMVYEHNPRGVLNFALKGLKRLINQRGFFSNPSSGKAEIEAWQLDNDIVGLFLRDLYDGEIDDGSIRSFNAEVRRRKGAISKKMMWELFKSWLEEQGRQRSRVYKSTFYRLMDAKGYKDMKIEGTRCLTGFELVDIMS